MTRPPFLLVTVVACFIGWATTVASGISMNFSLATATLFGAVIIHAGVNVLNDYYDALNGADNNNEDRLYPFTGGSRFIQNQVMSLESVAGYWVMLLAVGAVIGIGLAVASGPGLWIIGVFGLFLGWAYSAPPVSLNNQGLGELSVALGFGILIPMGADYVQRGTLDWPPVLAGLSYALLVTNILYIAQFPDRRADAAAGKHHWVVRLGHEQARWGYLISTIIAYSFVVCMIIVGYFPVLTFFSVLPVIASAIAAAGLLKYAGRPQKLRLPIVLTIIAALTHGLLLSVTLPG